MRRVLGAILPLFCILAMLPGRAAATRMSAPGLCFSGEPVILRCVASSFEAYWGGNGGLPVFGYPLTEARPEYNQDSGAELLTQWFERYRLEIHPQNPPPYQILLGRMGAEALAGLGRDPRTEPREAGPQDGCLWFEQTGHNVCDQAVDSQLGSRGFRQYWESHGLTIDGLTPYERSLQLFGLPLSAPRIETNSSGDSVLTQWFERARFEWHPGNPPESQVLLGRLGAELRAQSPANAPASIFGLEIGPTGVAGTIDYAAHAKASTVRYNGLLWSAVEPTRGARNWAAVAAADAELKALGERGLSPILIIRGTPGWAQAAKSACGPIKAEALGDFAAFLGDAVRRYGAPPYNVKYWELWNEPDVDPTIIDSSSAFGCWGDLNDPYYGGERYAAMLKQAYPAIKAADPAAVVLSGGLLLECDPTLANQTPPCRSGAFFEGMLRGGGGDAVDVIAYHAYTYWRGQTSDWNIIHPVWKHRGGVFKGKLDYLRATMHRYGVRKPIAMDEGGLLCYRSEPSCLAPGLYQAQANQVVRMFTRSAAEGLWGANWYTLNGPGWQEGGLLDRNQRPRPAYVTFAFLSHLLEGATYECRPEGTAQRAPGGGALEGHAFRRGRATYQIYWTNDSSRVRVALPAGTSAIYSYTAETLPPGDGSVEVGFEPVIIVAEELRCAE